MLKPLMVSVRSIPVAPTHTNVSPAPSHTQGASSPASCIRASLAFGTESRETSPPSSQRTVLVLSSYDTACGPTVVVCRGTLRSNEVVVDSSMLTCVAVVSESSHMLPSAATRASSAFGTVIGLVTSSTAMTLA